MKRILILTFTFTVAIGAARNVEECQAAKEQLSQCHNSHSSQRDQCIKENRGNTDKISACFDKAKTELQYCMKDAYNNIGSKC